MPYTYDISLPKIVEFLKCILDIVYVSRCVDRLVFVVHEKENLGSPVLMAVFVCPTDFGSFHMLSTVVAIFPAQRGKMRQLKYRRNVDSRQFPSESTEIAR
jgi:hypothetical protein